MSEADRSKNIPDFAIREELARILASRIFVQSERLGRFLRFTIESVLSGEAETLKEFVIGTEVYDRKPPYQPNVDSIVRTEARRLRSKLKDYYESEGSADPVLIYFRPGSYVPVIRLKEGLTREPAAGQFVDGDLLIEGKGISIAVIPFKDISGDSTSAACAAAITDELIHELMRTEGCRVTSATFAGTLEQDGPDLPALAKKLHVQIFFEGSVRHEGQYLRVTARIVTADGFQLWSQRFESTPEADELFSVSEQIARSLINRTRPEISSIRKLKASAGSAIWEVFPVILSGESLMDEGAPGDIRMAMARFNEVLQVSPGHPRPHCGIAQCYYELALRGVGISAAAIADAKTRAQQASELDPELMQARGCTAALLMLEWNWKAATEGFRQALELGSHAVTYRQYALFLAVGGRFDEAWHYLQKAQHMDPFSQRQKLACARFFLISRRYEEGARYAQQRLIYGQMPVEAHLYLALTYLEQERVAEAARIAHEVQRYFGAEPTIAACLAEVLGRCGETVPANELVHNFRLLSPGASISRFRQTLLAVALGDEATALSLLAAAYSDREPEMIWLGTEPRLDAIRNNSRFRAIEDGVMSGR